MLFENYSLSTPTLSFKNNRCSKNVQNKKVCLLKRGYMINDNKIEADDENRSHRYELLDLGLDMDINILYIKCISV